jgi:hypothetical protein
MSNSSESLPADPSAFTGSAVPQPLEDLYTRKVEYMASALRVELEERVATGAASMIHSADQRDYRLSESIDFYDALRKKQARDASRKAGTVISELQSSRDETQGKGDVFDKVVALVALDRDGHAPITGHDNVTFAAGRQEDADLDALTYEGRVHELRDNPVALTKAERTIGLLINHGIYKLANWGNGSQLETALSLLRSYTEWIPEFDPDRAAAGDAAYALMEQRAAIQADQTTKPNYQYAKPERQPLNRVADEGLNVIAEVQAHYFLRTHDIVLPAAPAEQ